MLLQKAQTGLKFRNNQNDTESIFGRIMEGYQASKRNNPKWDEKGEFFKAIKEYQNNPTTNKYGSLGRASFEKFMQEKGFSENMKGIEPFYKKRLFGALNIYDENKLKGDTSNIQRLTVGEPNPLESKPLANIKPSMKCGGKVKLIKKNQDGGEVKKNGVKGEGYVGTIDLSKTKESVEYEKNKRKKLGEETPIKKDSAKPINEPKKLVQKNKKGGWIQDAVNPEHKGYCTPMTKETCTPARKAFAMTMKKHHGFHEK